MAGASEPECGPPEDAFTCWCGESGTFAEMFGDALRSHCGGSGQLRCLCGGDFCVCHYHGETECPGCEDCEYDAETDFGEGEYDPYDQDRP